ncbi:MAG: biotin carboxylase N-terminal domain-containing protein [Candidatus Binatia bacterium]|nr:biotin carboxylase N-terminal domain-containing protein [Candidatus Binatia bacterium]
MRILIANRGEIARRIQRTAHRLGHETVAAYADPDANAPFVAEATFATRLGPVGLGESYLGVEALLAAAERTGATAVHPGYGFLSENAAFARAVEGTGRIWIGPHAEAIEKMGSKIEARRIAAAAGVPTIPGFDESQDPATLAEAAGRIGYPVLVKAAAGGGGKGIRIVHEAGAFADALDQAKSESRRSFGDDAMIVERYIQRPRHVEVQIVGDRHGALVELGTRECSVQRRYQKMLEEAPAPNLPDATREGLRKSAADLARAMRYDSAGTVEYVVDAETGDYFFLEVNTRLQVEHPVTEAVTGLDLVELQIRSAAGEPLPISQEEVSLSGHAFEVRINAEDPAAGFAPQIGSITALRVPDGVRWDSGVERGSEITPYYDSMIAKLIVFGPDREVARRRLAAALDEILVGGITTTAGFHRWLVEQPAFVAAEITTRFLDETEIGGAGEPTEAAEAAALAWVLARREHRDPGPWGSLGPFRVTGHRPSRKVFLVDSDESVHEICLPDVRATLGTHLVVEGSDQRSWPVEVDVEERTVAIGSRGHTHSFRVRSRSDHWAPSADAGHGSASAIVAPFPGVVTEVRVVPGGEVRAGDVLVVIEAMKMLHSLAATGPGCVAEVRVAVADQVVSHQVLVTFEERAGDA